MSRMGDWLLRQALVRGVSADLAKGAVEQGDQRGGTLRVLPTVLTSLQAQLTQDHAPDPTLGTPFASRVPSSDWSTVAQMGPGQPATPFPLGGEPRQWVYRVGWNFPTPPDSDRRIDGQLLRQLADSFFLLRRAIEVRKAEITALDWDIVPSSEALQDPRFGDTQRARAKTIQREYGPLIRQIREFFAYPEAYYTTRDGQTWRRKGEVAWKDWLNAVIEDYFVGDWVTLWPQRTLSGELLSLRRVDGEHTKVLLNLDGRLPAPPMPAYQQYLYGVPRANFTQDDLYWWPRNLRNITPYGFSHVEQMLILILLSLKFDQWNLAMYTESTLPMGILEAPDGLSPDQLTDIANMLNGTIAGNTGQRLKVHPAPAGTKWQAIKPFVFDPPFANYLIDLLCAGMDVTRQELGFAPSNSEGLGGSGHAQAQERLDKRKGTVPLARWVEEKINTVIRDWWDPTGAVAFRYTDLITEDLAAKYDANEKAIRSGQVSLDQVLEELGNEGVGWGHMIETKAGVILPDQKLLLTPSGVLPIQAGAQTAPAPGMTGDPQQDAFTAALHHAARHQAQHAPTTPPSDGRVATKGAWHEADHPRDDDGKFTDGGGGGRAALVPLDRDHPPAHLAALKIPPAWTDVHVNPDPQGALQAVGRDTKGRAQYVYHADFAATQAAQKFSRVDRLRQEFGTVASQNAARQAADDARTRAHADCLAVIMALGIRPGSDADTQATVQAYGATTLEGRHVVTTDGTTRLQYVGKKGVALDLPVHDPEVADLLRQRAAAAGPTGRLFPDVSGDSLRRYTQTLDHGTFKPKDFRTLKGTTVALDAMAALPVPTAPPQYRRAVKQVATQVARVLGNTPTVALQSYIDPTIFGDWRAHAHV